MEGDVGELEMWEPLWSARCSPATSSAGSLEDVGDDLDDLSAPGDAEDKVFAALPEVSDGKNTLLQALHNLIKDKSKLVIAHVHSPAEQIAKDWPMRVESSKTEDAVNFSGDPATPPVIDDTCELTPVTPLTHESGKVNFLLESSCNQDNGPSVDVEMCGKLQDPCTEAKMLEDEPDEELKKLHKAEMDLLSALQRIKEAEESYLHEVSQRKETERTLARQRMEINELRRQSYKLSDQLQDLNEHKLMLEQRITQIKSTAKDHVEEITEYFNKQSLEESKKRQTIEMDLLSTLQRVKELKTLFQNEKARREDMEEKVARQRTEIEETKRQRDKLYYDLQDVKEQKLQLERIDVSEEINRRRKAERDLFSALQRIKDLEHEHIHEREKRDQMEETMARQEEEIKATKIQLEEIHDKNMTQMKSAKFHEEKLADSKQLLQELQEKYENLMHDRDAAVAKAKELHQKNKQRGSMTNETSNTEFSFVELQQATKEFDSEFKISDDGFASIYKGFLRNTTVAIKLFHPQSMNGQARFHREVAVLSRVRHPNLITLLGACPNHLTLVYEFLPNGSLEDRLSCQKNTPPLTWKVRTRIIGEICSALAFIHSQKPYPIVHGDLNLGNILLDVNFVSKLGDLGICQLLPESNITTTNQQRHSTKNHRGTPCYIDSGEFLSARELMLWSDVNSFGIIILRLLTGRSQQHVAEIVEEAMEKRDLHSIMDASAGDWPLVQANQLAHLGLRCITMSGGRQPDLGGEAWEVIEPLMRDACLTAAPSQFAPLSNDDFTPSCFVCPIFQEVMNDPHIAADGFTYEATAIREWLDSGADTSPMTNLRLTHCNLTPNRALRSAIIEWQQHWK